MPFVPYLLIFYYSSLSLSLSIYLYLSRSEWFDEVERAKLKSRKPRLRNALFRCFLGPTIVNGIISLIYIVIK